MSTATNRWMHNISWLQLWLYLSTPRIPPQTLYSYKSISGITFHLLAYEHEQYKADHPTLGCPPVLIFCEECPVLISMILTFLCLWRSSTILHTRPRTDKIFWRALMSFLMRASSCLLESGTLPSGSSPQSLAHPQRKGYPPHDHNTSPHIPSCPIRTVIFVTTLHSCC